MSVLQSNQLNDLQKASKEQLSGSVHSVGSHHSSTSLSYDSLLSSKYSGARQYTTEKPAVSFSLTMTSLQETTDGANNDSESTLGSIVRTLATQRKLVPIFKSTSTLYSSTNLVSEDPSPSTSKKAYIVDPVTNKKYLPAPKTPNETQRLEALAARNLDSPDEVLNNAAYDNLTQLAAKLLGFPISCISLVEEARQWFKSHFGLDASETPKAYSFCAHAIHHPEDLFIVEDTHNDQRFIGNPLVTGSPNIRAYAGMPIVSKDGYPLGAFCVIDHRPRSLTPQQKETLRLLARQAESEIELRYTLKHLMEQNRLTERLLSNVLPQGVVDRLKMLNVERNQDVVIADRYACATILFADIVGFTQYARTVSAVELVNTLGALFTVFDNLCVKHGVTKIKTIGDGYMCVGGIPIANDEHAINAADLALEMMTSLATYNIRHGTTFKIRIGINSGPVMAGVIGLDKFTYDCFGDATNIASRMESLSQEGRIHLTQATNDLIKNDFICEERGDILVRGIGEMQTYFLISRTYPKN